MKNILSLTLIMLLVASNCFGASIWVKSIPLTSDYINTGRTKIDTNFDALDKMLAKYRQGCEISYDSAAQFTVELGELMCSNSDGTIRHMTQNTSSVTVTWADIDTGAEAGSTTYYVYGVSDGILDTFTVSISVSSSAPSGATYYKRLGSFYNDASSNITRLSNDGFFKNLGALVSRTFGTTYQATTDGGVMAYTYKDPTTNIQLIGYTDGSSTPTTKVQHSEELSIGDESAQSISFWVKAGDYWKVTESGGSDKTLYFIPKE